MENPVFTFFNELKQMVVDYVEAKLQLTKLKAYEKIASIGAIILSICILVFALIVTITAVSIAAGAWLNEIWHSSFKGYAVVAMIYVVIFLIMIFFRKQFLVKPLTNIFIKVLFKNDGKQKP